MAAPQKYTASVVLVGAAVFTVVESVAEIEAVFAFGPVWDCWIGVGVAFKFPASLAMVGCGNDEAMLFGDDSMHVDGRNKLEMIAKIVIRSTEKITLGVHSLNLSSDWHKSQNFRLTNSGHSARSIFSPQLQQKFGR